eukprot:2005293-Rhodomonas_salina.3
MAKPLHRNADLEKLVLAQRLLQRLQISAPPQRVSVQRRACPFCPASHPTCGRYLHSTVKGDTGVRVPKRERAQATSNART